VENLEKDYIEGINGLLNIQRTNEAIGGGLVFPCEINLLSKGGICIHFLYIAE